MVPVRERSRAVIFRRLMISEWEMRTKVCRSSRPSGSYSRSFRSYTPPGVWHFTPFSSP